MLEVQLSDLCDIRSGGTPARWCREYYGGSIPWAKIGDLNAGSDVFETEEYISESGLKAIRGRLFPPGTLLFAIYGSMGKMAFAGCELATNQAILGMQPLANDRIDLRYLYHYLSCRLDEFQDAGRGVTQKNLSATFLRELKIPLPGIQVQRRIAATLDKADAVRRKREEALNLANELLRSAYVHIVGHLNPAQSAWQTKTIEELAEAKKGSIRSGPFGSALKHSEFVAEGIAVLGIDNAVQNRFAWADRRFITPEKYEQLKRYRVHPNDVIITIMGTTGRSAVVPEDIPLSITTKHLATITCNARLIHPEVLSYAIHSDPVIIQQIQAYNKGAIMDGLNLGIIRKLKINLPPMDEQIRFVSILKSVRNFQERSSTPEMNGSDLFASLSQRAFRAEL